ncbi:MAG: sulfite exporter TauE/SafE family protein [Gammaproteobacteria bacterium]|nr:sulfite exporter TauE/SafE family protein [Gammaproteobacteria bacterium]NNJ83772.1 sulfite exporter TauE/SafE family protein [Gammaproteobacteria bacterium]
MLIEFFIVGLFSTTHCLIMCGPLIGGLTISLPVPIRKRQGTLFRYVLIYNTGRILSYAVAGFLAGTFGEVLTRVFDLERGYGGTLMAINSLFLVGIGLYIAGWLPGVALLERFGSGLWRSLSPLAESLLPVKSQGKALIFGVVWGWFPCGLTYTVLLWAITTVDPVKGALAMVAFGLGTFPGLLTASFLSGRLLAFRRSPWIMRGLGLSIILLAMIVGLRDMAHETHKKTMDSSAGHRIEQTLK